jgi:hypothetical protein
VFADFNNDGRFDFVSSRYGGAMEIVLNQGNLSFQVLNGYRSPNRLANTGDLDGDGKVDIVAQSAENSPDMPATQVWKNLYEGGNHWLKVKLVGADARNREAVGAKIWVFPEGSLEQGGSLVTYCQHGSHTGSPSEIHLGVGPHERVDVKIRFPSGTDRILRGVATNQRLSIAE